jgi:hypothetical protein
VPVAPVSPVAAGDVQFEEKAAGDGDDMEALRRWIRDKRMVTVKEIGGDLSLSGEVRAEFQDTNEERNGISQRGKGGAFVKPQYAWDVEVNIMVDYRTDRTWAAIKLEFDNDMGVRSGLLNKIKLEKAYLGGRMISADSFSFDGEIGRRFLSNVFDSRIEFGSLFDGILFRMKYSFIDWYKPAADELMELRFKYMVSQFLTSYQFYPEWIGKRLIKIYGAGLCNHIAPRTERTNYETQNWAWYTGVSIGLVKKKGDWALDANYQWVQAQAIPDFDSSGIGRGNTAGVGFYTNSNSGDPASGATTSLTAVGNGNYQGFEIEALYAFTDNLTFLQNFKYSNTLDTNIGPNLKYRQYEAEFIYAF